MHIQKIGVSAHEEEREEQTLGSMTNEICVEKKNEREKEDTTSLKTLR